jgi:hypothetical protein
LQFDLLDRGRSLDRLGTADLSWWDLWCIIKHLPHDAALTKRRYPDTWMWRLDTHLLAIIADALHTSNWQRQGDAKATRPQRIPRPGVKAEEDGVKRHRPKRLSTRAELDKRLGLKIDRKG